VPQGLTAASNVEIKANVPYAPANVMEKE